MINNITSKKNQLLTEGYTYLNINQINKKFINEIYAIIKKYKTKNISSENILDIQNKINKNFKPELFFKNNSKLLKILFDTNKFSVQHYFYLRSIEPLSKKNLIKPINFHRESFNSKNKILSKAFNLWIPIKNCTIRNAISYYPKSHQLEENKDFKIKDSLTNIKKYSTEHKLGYLYKEKKISFKKKIKTQKLFKNNHFIIFNGNLIHGAGFNLSKKTRYSLDLRFMISKDLKTNMKQSSTGKNYFKNIRL